MEVIGAASSIIGVATFGIQLASTIHNYIDTVRDAEENLRFIALDISTTAGTLERLKNFIVKDEAAAKSNEQQISTETGRRNVSMLASQCEKVYIRLFIIITGVPVVPKDDNGNVSLDTLDLSSMKVLNLGYKLKFPFKGTQIKSRQEELGLLKINLLLELRVMELAQERFRSPDASEWQTTMEAIVNTLIERRVEYIKETTSKRRRAPPRKSEAKEESASRYDLVDEKSEIHSRNLAKVMVSSQPECSKSSSSSLPLNSMELTDGNITPHHTFIAKNNTELQPSAESLKSVQRRQQSSHAAPALPAMSGALRNIQPSDVNSQPSVQQKPLETNPTPAAFESKGSVIHRRGNSVGSIILPHFSKILSWMSRPSPGRRSLVHDRQSEELEAYLIEDASSTPRRLLFGHQQLKNMLRRATKGKGANVGDQYLALIPSQRSAVDTITLEASRSSSRSKTCIAISPQSALRPGDPALVVFFSVGEPIQPVYLRTSNRVFCFAFELCQTWKGMEELIQSALGNDEEIGVYVRRDEYDLITPENYMIIPAVWNSIVKPGLTVLIISRQTPLGKPRLGRPRSRSPVVAPAMHIPPPPIRPVSRRFPSPPSRAPIILWQPEIGRETKAFSIHRPPTPTPPPSLGGRSTQGGVVLESARPSRDRRTSVRETGTETKAEDSEDEEGTDIIDFEAEQEISQLQVEDLLRRWTNAPLDTPDAGDDGQ